jgi:hypothetical protein
MYHAPSCQRLPYRRSFLRAYSSGPSCSQAWPWRAAPAPCRDAPVIGCSIRHGRASRADKMDVQRRCGVLHRQACLRWLQSLESCNMLMLDAAVAPPPPPAEQFAACRGWLTGGAQQSEVLMRGAGFETCSQCGSGDHGRPRWLFRVAISLLHPRISRCGQAQPCSHPRPRACAAQCSAAHTRGLTAPAP